MTGILYIECDECHGIYRIDENHFAIKIDEKTHHANINIMKYCQECDDYIE
jgi:ribosomal protein L33